MPVSCGVYGCTNSGNKNGEMSFHILPSEKTYLKKKWLQNIRKEAKIPKSLAIWSDHF